MERYFKRVQPQASARMVLTAGTGGFLAIASLALLTSHANLLLLMAPFGASCVLLLLLVSL